MGEYSSYDMRKETTGLLSGVIERMSRDMLREATAQARMLGEREKELSTMTCELYDSQAAVRTVEYEKENLQNELKDEKNIRAGVEMSLASSRQHVDNLQRLSQQQALQLEKVQSWAQKYADDIPGRIMRELTEVISPE